MSLLMDALRKAEAEKKKAASGEDQGAVAEASPVVELPESAPVPVETGSSDAPDTLKLEPLEVAAAADTDAPDADAVPPVPPAGMALELDEDLDRSLELESAVEFQAASERSPYDQESTLPSERAVQKSLTDYFDSSQSMEMESGTRPRQSVPGERSTAPADVISGTQVGAETVFQAGERTNRKPYFALIGATALVAVAVGAAGVYYSLQSAGPMQMQAPPIAQGPAPATPAVPLPVVAETALEAPVAVPVESIEVEEAAQVPAELAADAAPVATMETLDESADLEPLVASNGDAGLTINESVEFPGAVAKAEPATLADALPAMPLPLFAPETPQTHPAPPGIKVARRPARVDAASNELEAAYAALSRGDYREATQGYEAVLKRFPDNRDALLGRAAVAVKTGAADTARQYYLRALAQDPRDRVAQAALLSLRPQLELADESRLKALTREPTATPYAYFALGNHYARTNRWVEAQGAYFEAHRGAPEQPDFVMNLAISLDRLGQSKAAAAYYRKALDLARDTDAGFDTVPVARRLAEALP